jgi:hypothetical protein
MSEKTLARRVEDILRVPAFLRIEEDEDNEWLVCPHCEGEVMVHYTEFKRCNRDRALVACLYCHAFSRRPGMTAMKVRAILKRKAKKE